MKYKTVKNIFGDISVDDRGLVNYINDFNFKYVKRFYHVSNYSIKTVRAFHGHLKEEKYVYVVTGSIIACLVKLTNFKIPSKKSVVERYVLSSKKPAILYIPKGYANGFRALEKNTNVIFYSTSTLDQSKNDDYRFPYDYWGKDIWEIKNR